MKAAVITALYGRPHVCADSNIRSVCALCFVPPTLEMSVLIVMVVLLSMMQVLRKRAYACVSNTDIDAVSRFSPA